MATALANTFTDAQQRSVSGRSALEIARAAEDAEEVADDV